MLQEYTQPAMRLEYWSRLQSFWHALPSDALDCGAVYYFEADRKRAAYKATVRKTGHFLL